MERVFTEAEANALLPTLGPLLEQLREAHHKLRAVGRAAGLRAAANGSPSLATATSEPEREYEELLSQIDGLGVLVRDPNTGLIDFAAVRGAEPIYLCWRLGEDQIAFWHPRDTGMAGRQPL